MVIFAAGAGEESREECTGILNSKCNFFFFGHLIPEPGMCVFSRAAPEAHGGSQAKGLTGAVATGLRQSHSNAGSKLHMRHTRQLKAILDP